MAVAEAPTAKLAVGMRDIEIADLIPAPDNLRTDLGDLTELIASIREAGVIEPLVVTTDRIIVAGHRRHAAALEAGVNWLPCVVREMTEAERIAAMLHENLQRCDLTPVEEGTGYQRLLDLGAGESDEDIAKLAGVRTQRVRDRLALAKLPLAAQIALRDKRLPIADGLLLAKLAEVDPEAAQAIVDERVSRRTDDYRWEAVGHVANRELLVVQARVKRQTAIDRLPEGTTVIEWDGVVHADYDRWPKGARLVVKQSHFARREIVVMPPKEHAKLKCHAVIVDAAAKVHEMCSNPRAKHPTAEEWLNAGRAAAAAVEETRETVPSVPRPSEILTATVEARTAAALRVIDDPACRDELFGALLSGAANEWTYASPQALVPEWGIGDDGVVEVPNPERAALALGLCYLSAEADVTSWMSNPFRDDGVCRYYELLEAHDYELSEGETALRIAAIGVEPEDEA